jgi:hypothetical protein
VPIRACSSRGPPGQNCETYSGTLLRFKGMAEMQIDYLVYKFCLSCTM